MHVYSQASAAKYVIGTSLFRNTVYSAARRKYCDYTIYLRNLEVNVFKSRPLIFPVVIASCIKFNWPNVHSAVHAFIWNISTAGIIRDVEQFDELP